jgi:hypothetical protein
VFLNAAKRDFGCDEVESLYPQWVEGSIQDGEVFYRAVPEKAQARGTFLTANYGSSLSVFHRPGHELCETSADIPSGGVSPWFSPQGFSP